MTSLRHVGLLVENADRALTLYSDILKFHPRIDQVENDEFFQHLVGIDNSSARTVKCYSSFDDSCIELIEYITPKMKHRDKSINALGFNHIALNVQNIESLSSDLTRIGLKFLSAPKVNNENTVIVGFCWDFEGNLLELVESL